MTELTADRRDILIRKGELPPYNKWHWIKFTYDTRIQVWLKNIAGYYYIPPYVLTIAFSDEEDATLFKLTWL